MNKLMQMLIGRLVKHLIIDRLKPAEIDAGVKAALLLLKARNLTGPLAERMEHLDVGNPTKVFELATEVVIKESSPYQLVRALRSRRQMRGTTLEKIAQLTPDCGDCDCYHCTEEGVDND